MVVVVFVLLAIALVGFLLGAAGIVDLGAVPLLLLGAIAFLVGMAIRNWIAAAFGAIAVMVPLVVLGTYGLSPTRPEPPLLWWGLLQILMGYTVPAAFLGVLGWGVGTFIRQWPYRTSRAGARRREEPGSTDVPAR